GSDDMELVGGVDPAHGGELLSELVSGAPEISVAESVQVGIDAWGPEVMVDFTRPEAVMDNLRTALNAGVACVVGTTGFSPETLEEVRGICAQSGTAAVIAPNFSIGANLMMKFAEEAARSLDYAAVIECHHENKLDAPSGTAQMTVERMAAAREEGFRNPPTTHFGMEGVRGGDEAGIQVFSVRMKGTVANQEVIFGGLGETLTIEHVTTGRECFMPGVLLAVRRVRELDGLVYGLQALLDG
ncbi:MAG: 4-hydroxy-tetrahydrodipicolinate reductase, partial [Armatimonadetes bacterium]|nr:4-hydroxy-tetrahydrodipicolinate reductase [Armatimonadota bacterium]